MNVLIVGAGFCGRAIAFALRHKFPLCRIGMTSRESILLVGFDYLVRFNDDFDFSTVTHLVMTAPPMPIDPFLQRYRHADFSSLQHVLYLSTTAVYGDHGGGFVDETTPVNPMSERAQRRVKAERDWIDLGYPICLFRLSGLYGENRNAFADLKTGKATRIYKDKQVFNRIHHDDVGRISAILCGLAYEGLVNGADDCPAPSHEVIAYAATLIGLTPPPLIDFNDALLTPMARSFWSENKRIRNDLLHQLSGDLLFPGYKEGLSHIFKHLEAV